MNRKLNSGSMSAYLSHLAQVNEIQPVYAKSDIHSEQGELLVSQNSPIDHDIATQLSQHKLHKKIETSIALKDEFTADMIFELITNFVLSDPAIAELYQAHNLNERLVKCVEAFSEHDILRQKLNVLAIQIPDVFDQALFCAWMAITVLANEDQPQNQLDNAFIAALSHDLGLLSVSPEILFKPEALTTEEWQAMQQHPMFSASLLTQLNTIDKQCIRAVMEHHEAPDGTGYPNGKLAQQLGELGQLLYILDSTNAIYRKHFKNRKRSLHDLVPIMQIATLSQGGAYAPRLVALLNSTKATDHCTINTTLIPSAIDLIKANADEINQFVTLANEFTKDVGTQHKDFNLLSLQNILRLIRASVDSCGIINDAYLRWLDQVRDEKLEFAYRELEDVLLMTQEIKFHIQRFSRQASIYLSLSETGEQAEKTANFHAEVGKIPRAEIAESALQAYLQGQTDSH